MVDDVCCSLSLGEGAGLQLTSACFSLPIAESDEVLQCHGAAEEALAAASATIKALLSLPAQAAQVSPGHNRPQGTPGRVLLATITISSWQSQGIDLVHSMYNELCVA